MQQMAFMLWAVCLGTITFASDYTGIVIVVVLLGLCDGVMACVVVPILFDLLGPAGASAGLGSVFGLMAPLAVIGPFLTGAVFRLDVAQASMVITVVKCGNIVENGCINSIQFNCVRHIVALRR